MGGKMSSNSKHSIVTDPKVKCIVIGAGCRGHGYSHYVKAEPDDFQIIAVAEPRAFYRQQLQRLCNIPDDNAYKDWTEVANKDKFADCVIITTQDKLHKDPAVAFAKKGYHILLEKPMATTEEDCREIVKACKENNVILTVCHVLRYTPWVKKIKELITSGAIGDVVNIQHLEPVGFWHFAHSYVRGNWHKEADSSFSLLAKCCHDIDLISYWMGDGNHCKNVTSFGHLSHFNKENKPQNAADRCLDCPYDVESKCPYSALKLYMDDVKSGHRGWPVNVITPQPTVESVKEALKSSVYGKCVYDMDNDVMSQQVVNMQFADGATASLSMIAFTHQVCQREVKVFGTKGEIQYSGGRLKYVDFATEQVYRPDISVLSKRGEILSGHGGADFYTIESFVNAVKEQDVSKVITGADDTLASHLLVFAAEKARKENRIIKINDNMEFE